MPDNVLVYMATRADTPQRRKLLCDTLREAEDTAGMPLKINLHYVGVEDHDETYSTNATPRLWPYNVGQHVVFNTMLLQAHEQGIRWLLRLDDDVKFLTKRWLVKMLDAARTLGDKFIISSQVRGLLTPPSATEPIDHKGVRVRFITSAIGGICRLHPVATMVKGEYESDVRMPLGFGDATGVAGWAEEHMVWMVWLEHVRVKHRLGTSKQRDFDPGYHMEHDVLQRVPYIPPWSGV